MLFQLVSSGGVDFVVDLNSFLFAANLCTTYPSCSLPDAPYFPRGRAQVRKMKMISPTNREVDIGQTLAADEYIGMVRREVMDGFMRDRAIEKVRWYVGFNVRRGSRGERQRSSCVLSRF